MRVIRLNHKYVGVRVDRQTLRFISTNPAPLSVFNIQVWQSLDYTAKHTERAEK